MADLTLDQLNARLARIGGESSPTSIDTAAPPTIPTTPSLAIPQEDTTEQVPGFESIASQDQQEQPFTILPLSQAASDRVTRQAEINDLARPRRVEPSKYDLATRLGARPGVPFDMESGISWRNRLTMEREPTPDEQLQSLYTAYGKENVRLNEFGHPVVTTTDENGKTKDILVNPIGLDFGDTATLMSTTPELAGTIIPLLLTKGATLGPGVLKALGTLALTTGGSELAGAAKDMFTRWSEGRDVDVAEIAGRRSVSGAQGMMWGGALGLGGFIAGRAISPFAKPGSINFRASEAQKYIADKYGIDLPMTAAQKTGHPLLQASEALESQQPGARTVFSKFREKVLSGLEKLRDIATGRIDDVELTGKDALEKMKGALTPLEFDPELAAREADQLAEEAIKAKIGAPVDKGQIGASVSFGAKARKGIFDKVNEMNYEKFYSNPLSKAPVIEGEGLKADIDDLLSSLPKVRKEVEQTVVGADGKPILDATGKPLTRMVTVDEPVSTPIRPRLEELSAKLADGKVSINDLKQIRTDVDNSIKTGEAIPGVKEGRLKQLYGYLTKSIEEGLNTINDSQLTQAWNTAKDYYANNVGKFETAGIAELFRDPINAIGPTQLVQRALKDPDVYKAYTDFFGVGSPQLRGIQQAARDEVLGIGRLGRSVNAAQFAQRLEELDARSPKLLDDAFGKNAAVLRSEASTMMRAQGQELPRDELRAALSSGTLSGDRLRDMMQAEERRTIAYQNDMVKRLSKGTIGPDQIKPTQVVDKLVFREEAQPEHLIELMDVAAKDPSVQEDLRRLSFKEFLDRATIMDREGNRVLNAHDMDAMLRNPNLSKKLQTVLGPDSFEDLQRIRDFVLPMESTYTAGKTAGQLAGGSLLNRLLGKGDLAALPQFVKNFVLSTVYTSDTMRRYFSNSILQQEGKALIVNGAIASEPWLRALGGTFTKEEAKNVQVAMKGAVDRLSARNPGETLPATKSAEGIPWNELLKRLDKIPDSNQE